MDKTQEIKAQLEELLKSDEIDYSRFTTLSNELLKQDREHVRFSVDAGIINRLGKELVGRAETAISELIKNAYDAEASYAHLVFKDAIRAGGSFEIEDDGNGMTYEELINGFMRISSSDKIHRPVSPRYKRKKAGKKGIGRFAAQRLGKQLIIITQTVEDTQAIKATINWDDYVIDSDINEVTGQIEYVEKERPCGTTLIINQLYDGWSDNAILRAYRYTEDLLIPEPLSRERKNWDEYRQDPGFKAYFYRERVSDETKVVDENVAFYDHALAVIEGFIDEKGQGYWRMWSNKLDVSQGDFQKIGADRDNKEALYEAAHSIHFKTYYFIYERSLIPGSLYTYVKNLGTEVGGIKLYRNGFRVPPYGEKNNDWLGLDSSVRRKTLLFPHQNQSFFGYVEIDDNVEKIDNKKPSNVVTAINVEGRTYAQNFITKEFFHNGYNMVFLLFSKNFNGMAEANRETIVLTDSNKQLFRNIFIKYISKILNETYPDIATAQSKKREQLEGRYPHLSGYIDGNSIGYMQQNEVLGKAEDQFFRAQREILNAPTLNQEQYEKAKNITSLSLTQYILFRQRIIDKLKSLDAGNREEEVHNLICPRYRVFDGKTSYNDLYKQNLWLIDDRFMTYTNVLSEKDMTELFRIIDPETDFENTGRPDIAIVFSSDPNTSEKFDIVIIELKREGIDIDKTLGVERQLSGRARELYSHFGEKSSVCGSMGLLKLQKMWSWN